MPHVIRLRSPWQIRLLLPNQGDSPRSFAVQEQTDEGHNQGEPRPIHHIAQQLPQLREQAEVTPEEAATLLADAAVAVVLLTRFFNSPTNLSENDRMTLSLPTLSSSAVVYLNDQTLAAMEVKPAETEATQYVINSPLQRRNRVDIAFDLRRNVAAATQQASRQTATQILGVVEQARLVID